MKKGLTILMWLLTITVAVLTIIAISRFVTKKRDARPFNKYDFAESLYVNNMTDYDRVDTLCLYLAHHILELDTVHISVVYIPEHIKEGEIDFYGIIQYLPFQKNQFLILLNRDGMSLSKLKETLAHEFVHADQYLSGDLVLYPKFAIWKGEDVYFGEMPYDERPFEIDAFARDGKFLKKLNEVLYK